jgi:hypothetical protein
MKPYNYNHYVAFEFSDNATVKADLGIIIAVHDADVDLDARSPRDLRDTVMREKATRYAVAMGLNPDTLCVERFPFHDFRTFVEA